MRSGLALVQQFAAFVGENPAQHMGHGGFATAAFAGDGDKFPRLEGQIDVVQTHYHGLSRGVEFRQPLQV